MSSKHALLLLFCALLARGQYIPPASTGGGALPANTNAITSCNDTTASTTAYQCAPGAFSSLATGNTIYLKVNTANSTGTPNLAVDGLAAKTIVRGGGQAVVANELVANVPYLLQYDGASWRLITPAVDATGIVRASTLTLTGGITAPSGFTVSGAAFYNGNNIVFSVSRLSCTAGAVTLGTNTSVIALDLISGATCTITWGAASFAGIPIWLKMCNPNAGNTAITWTGNIKGGISSVPAGGCATQIFTYETTGTAGWYAYTSGVTGL